MNSDDGAVVYLNGAEVIRKNLPRDTTPDTLAVEAAGSNGLNPETYGIDAKLLQPGANVVAAEVHQEDAASADLYFHLTLGPRLPDSELLTASTSNEFRGSYLWMIAQLGMVPEEHYKVLKQMLHDDDIYLRTLAITALATTNQPIGTVLEAPRARDSNEQGFRKSYAALLNHSSWETVNSDDFNAQQFRRALRYAAAACALEPEANVNWRTLGMARYRTGQYLDALKALEKDEDWRRENAFNVAFIAMSNQQLMNFEEAQAGLKRLRELSAEPLWQQTDDCRNLLREAEELIATK